MTTPTTTAAAPPAPKSRGFWAEAWRRFYHRKLAMVGLSFVVLLAMVALFSPAIAGTKPIICQYKGHIYFPCMFYFNPRWQNPIFVKDGIFNVTPDQLKTSDPKSWAIWPLVYQDPLRRVLADERPGQPANPIGDKGRPDSNNFMGTNRLGVDVFAQIVHGTRVALLVGFISTGLAAVIGVCVGAIAGFFGGWVDTLLSRLIEVVMCIPSLVLILALLAIVEHPSIWHVMGVLGVTGWTGIARLTRGEFLKLKQSEFVTAAQALGTRRMRIIFRHILPNSLAPVMVPITFGIASAILLEAALSFLGVGGESGTASWGKVLSAGRSNIQNMWWLILFPGIAIFLTVLCYNLVGEGVQEATDPRLRQAGK